VHPDAEVTDSVIMPDVVIGPGARVDRAVVDKYSQIGAGAVVGDGEPLDRPEFAWLEGLTVLGKDVVVPDGARIGRQAVLGVGAGPSDFTDGRISAGLRIPDRLAHAGLV
jgi:glucose-1-phosphate adenylyltransferase